MSLTTPGSERSFAQNRRMRWALWLAVTAPVPALGRPGGEPGLANGRASSLSDERRSVCDLHARQDAPPGPADASGAVQAPPGRDDRSGPRAAGAPVQASGCSSDLDEGEIVVVEHPGLEPADAPGSVTIVPVDETLGSTADLGAAVRRVPGAVVSSLGGLGDLSQVSLRGTTARQVEVRVDGISLNPDGTSAIDLSALPLRAFSALEVWRGVTPAALGAHGPGGVIDLVTGSPGGPAKLAIAAAGGSWGTVTGRASASGARGLLVVDGLATRGDFPYFSDAGTPYVDADDATLRRANNRHQRLAGVGVLRAGPWRALGLVTAQSDGVPGPVSRPTSALVYAARTGLLGASRRWALGAATLTTTVSATGRWETLDDAAGEITGAPAVRDDLAGLVGARGEVSALLTPEISLSADLSTRLDAVGGAERLSGQPTAPHLRSVTWAAAGLTIRRGILRLDPGVSLGILAPFDGAPTLAPLPVLAGRLRISDDLSVRAGVSRTFRPPDLFELYGDRGALRGNGELRPEWAWQAEIGLVGQVRTRAVDLFVDVAGYGRAVTDLITWVQNAQGAARPINLDRAQVAGLEASARLEVEPWLSAGTTVAATAGLNPDRAAPLPRLPAIDVAPWLSLRWPDRARLTWTTTVTSPIALDEAGVLRTPTRVLHGLSARLEPVVPGAPTFTVDVNNLFDRISALAPRNPFDPAAGLGRVPQSDHLGYPLAGRTVLLGATWETR